MLVRISLRRGDDQFVPYTFVRHTGAPKHMFLSHAGMDDPRKWLIESVPNELGSRVVIIDGRKAAIRATSHNHQPGNILADK